MDPAKDADGLHPTNLGRLVLGVEAPLPCTPRGIVELLRRYDVPLDGAEVVVVGRGITVGRPMGLLLTRRSENATVTLCHTGTRDLAAHLRARRHHRRRRRRRRARHSQDMSSRAPPCSTSASAGVDGVLAGDVALDVREVAGFVAPIPGGVGPMTRAMLLTNVVEAAERAADAVTARLTATRATTAADPRAAGSASGRRCSCSSASSASLVVVALGHFRRGSVLLAGVGGARDVPAAAAARATRPGLLVVRSKTVDVIVPGRARASASPCSRSPCRPADPPGSSAGPAEVLR